MPERRATRAPAAERQHQAARPQPPVQHQSSAKVTLSASSGGRPLYVAHAVPGLEQVALDDLGSSGASMRTLETIGGFDERTSLLIFRSAEALETLLERRTLEDLFALTLVAGGIHGGYSGTREIRELVAQDRGLDAAASIASAVRPRRRRKTTFRVIARMAGGHAFRRSDVGRAVALGVAERFPDWLEVDDDAQFELWASLIDDRLILAVRLSSAEMRTRTYRDHSLPGALKPTLAYAMAVLSEPQAGDVVLDPMCGAGTLLIERAHAGRYRRLLGGDIENEPVLATLDNVGPRYQPIGIARWDARSLPLPDASVSVVLANLPFGHRFGSPEGNRLLYPGLLDEWSRVLAPNGRLVLLTPEQALLRRSLASRGRFEVRRTLDVLVRGQPATIHVVQERAAT